MKPALLIALTLVVGCAPDLPASFVCTDDTQCRYQGVSGICQPTGACSFADDTCASGQRYGQFGSTGLAGTCVGGSDAGVPGMISRVGTSELAYGPHATVDVMAPAGIVAGDLLFACVLANSASATLSPPGGWTTHFDLAGIAGDFHAAWLYKVVGANEPSSYTFPVSGSPTNVGAGVVAYRGVAMSPIDASTNREFTGAPLVAPSITTTHANDMLLTMFVQADVGLGLSPPAGMSAAVDNGPILMADVVQAAPGPTGTKAATSSPPVPGIGAVDFVALTPAP
jgi:hypothetical protein